MQFILSSKTYGDQVAIIDDTQAKRVLKHKWYLQVDDEVFTAVATINGKRIRLHRFVTRLKRFRHLNGNKLDCRSENRVSTAKPKKRRRFYYGEDWDYGFSHPSGEDENYDDVW